MKNRIWFKNLILLVVAIAIALVPLLCLKNAEFGGADGQAADAIIAINEEYEPWFNNVLELPSGEIESLMFALQAAIGAGVVGFVLGRITSRGKNEKIETQ